MVAIGISGLAVFIILTRLPDPTPTQYLEGDTEPTANKLLHLKLETSPSVSGKTEHKDRNEQTSEESLVVGASEEEEIADKARAPSNHATSGSGSTTRDGLLVLPASDLPIGYDWQEVRHEDDVMPGLEVCAFPNCLVNLVTGSTN